MSSGFEFSTRSEDASWLQWQQEDLLLRVRVQPKAGREGFVEPYGNSMKIRVNAPPVEGKANSRLLRFLAKTFAVPIRQVCIEAGKTSKNKLVRISRPKILPTELQSLTRHS